MIKCKHNVHPMCIGRECKYVESVDGIGICILDYQDRQPEDDEEDED